MAAQQNFSVDNVVVRHAKANTVRCLNIDEITKHFTSVLVGRQIFRAGVLSAVLTPIALPWVLSPLMDALGMAPHMPADFKRGAITTATLITALTAAIAFVLYVKLYRGSRGVLRIIRFFKPIARISVYLIYLYLLVALFALLYIGHDPLIVVYAIALTINIGILVYFLRWTLKC